MATATVYDVFVNELGIMPDEFYLQLEVTSVCGISCVMAISRAKGLLGNDLTSPRAQEILRAVERECDTYLFG